MGLFGAAGIAASAMFVLAHGLIKSSLFVCAGNYLNRFRSLDENVLGGLGAKAPLNSALYIIGGLTLAGMPPFAISAAKVLYDAAMKDRALFAVAAVMAFASAIDAGAVVRSGLHVTFGWGKGQITGHSPREEEPECDGPKLERTPWTMLAVPVTLLAIAIWLGMSDAFRHGVERAAHAFVDRQYYVAAVLYSVHRAMPQAPLEPRTAQDIGINLGVTAAAIIAALLGLFRDHIPQMLSGVLGPPLKLLRGLHSGIFTDYVAYMMVGIAAYAAYLVIAAR
jgi:multicomponent Na+:H+ antiporter subunit D